MNTERSLFSLAMMSVSIVAGYLLFRGNPREDVVNRGPLFIICCLPFFYIGFATLPLAIPDGFKHVLGHSVFVSYMPSARLGETQEGGTWWVMRWLEPIRDAYFYVVLVGVVWAGFNAVRRRAWKLNVICALVGAFLWAVHIFLSVTTLIG